MLYKDLDSLVLDEEDMDFLKYIRDTYKDKSVPFQGKNPDGTIRKAFHNYKNFYLKNSENSYIEKPIFKKIAKLCQNFPEHSDVNVIYTRAHLAYVPGELPYHIDARECVLTIPIGDVDKPISWVDSSGVFLGSYFYKGPVLINTKILHGCLENTSDRFLFQIGFNLPFDEASQLFL